MRPTAWYYLNPDEKNLFVLLGTQACGSWFGGKNWWWPSGWEKAEGLGRQIAGRLDEDGKDQRRPRIDPRRRDPVGNSGGQVRRWVARRAQRPKIPAPHSGADVLEHGRGGGAARGPMFERR